MFVTLSRIPRVSSLLSPFHESQVKRSIPFVDEDLEKKENV